MLDPFVGTASILVGASHFGAHCTGFDIDMRVLKGNMHAGVRTGSVPAAITEGCTKKAGSEYREGNTSLTEPPADAGSVLDGECVGVVSSLSTSNGSEEKGGEHGKGGHGGKFPFPKKKPGRTKQKEKVVDIQRSIWENFRSVLIVCLQLL